MTFHAMYNGTFGVDSGTYKDRGLGSFGFESKILDIRNL